MTEPKIPSNINTSDSVNPTSSSHACMFVPLPFQGSEDGTLVSKVIISDHGLALDKYICRTKIQRDYLDNFVSSIIREFCSLLDSYTKVK